MTAATSTAPTDADLARRLLPHARSRDLAIACGPGWWPIIDDCHRRIEARFPDYELLAVKQKYGQLAFQAFPSPWKPGIAWRPDDSNELDRIVDDARERSATICETCGDMGQLHTVRGRLMTRCPRCLGLEG